MYICMYVCPLTGNAEELSGHEGENMVQGFRPGAKWDYLLEAPIITMRTPNVQLYARTRTEKKSNFKSWKFPFQGVRSPFIIMLT
jgi:hypothetical protein